MRIIVSPRPKRPHEILGFWDRTVLVFCSILPVQSRLKSTAVQPVEPGRCGRTDTSQSFVEYPVRIAAS